MSSNFKPFCVVKPFCRFVVPFMGFLFLLWICLLFCELLCAILANSWSRTDCLVPLLFLVHVLHILILLLTGLLIISTISCPLNVWYQWFSNLELMVWRASLWSMCRLYKFCKVLVCQVCYVDVLDVTSVAESVLLLQECLLILMTLRLFLVVLTDTHESWMIISKWMLSSCLYWGLSNYLMFTLELSPPVTTPNLLPTWGGCWTIWLHHSTRCYSQLQLIIATSTI